MCTPSSLPGHQYLTDVSENLVQVNDTLNVTCLPPYTFPNNDTMREVKCSHTVKDMNGKRSIQVDWDIKEEDICLRKYYENVQRNY